MLVIGVSRYLWMVRSIIIPEEQLRRGVLIMVAIAQPLRLSSNEGDGFADL